MLKNVIAYIEQLVKWISKTITKSYGFRKIMTNLNHIALVITY